MIELLRASLLLVFLLGSTACGMSDASHPFQLAAHHCDVATLEALIEDGVSPNMSGRFQSPALVLVAAEQQDEGQCLEAAKLLLGRGADPNLAAKGSGQTALASSLMYGARLEMVELLVERGADPCMMVDIEVLSTGFEYSGQVGGLIDVVDTQTARSHRGQLDELLSCR